jgi:hypothetical protein
MLPFQLSMDLLSPAELIACASHNHALFKDDNALVVYYYIEEQPGPQCMQLPSSPSNEQRMDAERLLAYFRSMLGRTSDVP